MRNRIRLNLADLLLGIDQPWPGAVPILVDSGGRPAQTWPATLGKKRGSSSAGSGQPFPMFADIGLELGQIWPNVGEVHPHSTRTDPMSANVSPDSAKFQAIGVDDLPTLVKT